MYKTRKLTEIAVSVALAAVLSFFAIYKMPQGGSVSLTMIPLIFIAFRRGPLAGIAAGVIYGLINLAIDGVIYHPMSILLDYVLAFGVLGVAGFFPKKVWGIATGTVVGVAGRFISSVISGAVLFASYAPEGQNPWVYSLIYQSTYMVPELIIALVVLIFIALKMPALFDPKQKL